MVSVNSCYPILLQVLPRACGYILREELPETGLENPYSDTGGFEIDAHRVYNHLKKICSLLYVLFYW